MSKPYGFNPVELHSPPSFDGVPRKPMLSPGSASFYCPCCPLETVRPMFSEHGDTGATGGRVMFRCLDCQCRIIAVIVGGVSGALSRPWL